MSLTVEAWFPQLIWSGLLESIDNEKLKEFAYQRKEQTEGVHASNYIGWQSDNIHYKDNEVFDSVVATITGHIEDCRNLVNLPPLQLYNIWINVNGPGAYNHLHNHPMALLSGVYYVDSKEEQGNIFFERSDGAEYFLPPVEVGNHFNGSATSYKSVTGALYIFPGWLKHSVQPNTTEEDRISISFNYGVIK